MAKRRSKSYAVSRSRARRLLLGCTADNAVLLIAPESIRDVAQVLASWPIAASPAGANAALCAMLQELQLASVAPAGTRSLRVTLDDSLVRSFVVTPPLGAQGLRELRATVAARFAALYGDSAEHWLLVADWQAVSPFIACALPRQLCQALEQLARRHSWRLDSLLPAFVRVSNHLSASVPADGWLLVGFAQTLTLLGTRAEQVSSTRSVSLSAAVDFAELETLLTQERLRQPDQPDQRLGGPAQSLLWAGVADWLPTASSIAGLESRTISLLALPGQELPGAGRSPAGQLALAGSWP